MHDNFSYLQKHILSLWARSLLYLLLSRTSQYLSAADKYQPKQFDGEKVPLKVDQIPYSSVRQIYLEILGKTSPGWLSLRNISPWALEQLSSNIALYHFMAERADRHFSLQIALTAPRADKKHFSFITSDRTVTDAVLRQKVEERMKALRPVVDKHKQMAKTVVSRWTTFLSALAVSQTADQKYSLNFLKDKFVSQVSHLDEVPTLTQLEEEMQTKAVELKAGKRHIKFDHIRGAIGADLKSLYEERAGFIKHGRSLSFKYYEEHKAFNFSKPSEVKLCDVAHLRHTDCAPAPAAPAAPNGASTTPPTTTTGSSSTSSVVHNISHLVLDPADLDPRKKRDTLDQVTTLLCYHHWCHVPGTGWRMVEDRRLVKRQLLAPVAFLAVAALLASIGSYVYTAKEVEILHRDLGSTNTAVRNLITSMGIAQSDIFGLNRKLDDTGDTIMDILKVLDLREFQTQIAHYDSAMHFLFSEVTTAITAQIQAYGDLRRRKFPFGISSISELSLLYEALKKRSHTLNMELYLDSAAAILNCETYVVVFEGRPLLVTEIPARNSNEEELQVIRLQDRPIVLSNTTISIADPKPVVITSSDFSYYRALTTKDFEKCRMFRFRSDNWWWCGNEMSIFSKDIRNSCVMQILANNQQPTAPACAVKLGHLDDFASQLSPSTFLLYAENPEQVTVQCPRTASHVETFSGYSQITLDQGCTADTKSHRLFTVRDEIYFGSITQLQRPLDVSNIFSYMGMSDIGKALDIIQSHFQKQRNQNQPRELQLDAAKTAIEESVANEQWWTMMSHYKTDIFMTVSALIFVLVSSVAIYRCLRTRRRNQRMQRQLQEEAGPNAQPLLAVPLPGIRY